MVEAWLSEQADQRAAAGLGSPRGSNRGQYSQRLVVTRKGGYQLCRDQAGPSVLLPLLEDQVRQQLHRTSWVAAQPCDDQTDLVNLGAVPGSSGPGGQLVALGLSPQCPNL